MSKAKGFGNAFGKILTYVLVVLLLLGVAGGVTYFVMNSQGVTQYVEYGGQKYYGKENNLLLLPDDTPYSFSVKSVTGKAVDYSVKILANEKNNFGFMSDGKYKQFYSTTAKDNDYTKVFNLQQSEENFSLSIPKGFTIQKAVQEKFGGEITFADELDEDQFYFIIAITAGKSEIRFELKICVVQITIDPPAVIF